MTILSLRDITFHPTSFFHSHRDTWSIQSQDARSLALDEIDLDKIEFISVLKEDEEHLDYFSFEVFNRLHAINGILLDGRVPSALLDAFNDHSPIPASWKEKTDSRFAGIYFPGSILLHGDNFNSFAGLSYYEGSWEGISHNPRLGCTRKDWFAIYHP